jgi:hypothetical protein
MKREFEEDEILAAPVAEGAALFFCPNPDCQQPHLLLIDEDDELMAHFVIGDEFFADLAAAMKRKKSQ